jgi:hypothetical protein
VAAAIIGSVCSFVSAVLMAVLGYVLPLLVAGPGK